MEQLKAQITLSIKQSTFYTPIARGRNTSGIRCLPFLWAVTLLRRKPKLLMETDPIKQSREITKTIVMESLKEEEVEGGIFHYPGTELQWTLVYNFSAFLSEGIIIPYQKILSQDKKGVIWRHLVREYYEAESILATYRHEGLTRVLLSTLEITEDSFKGIPMMQEIPIEEYLKREDY